MSDSTPGTAARPARNRASALFRRRWYWILSLLLVAGAAAAFASRRHSAAPSGKSPRLPPAISVATQAARRGDIAVHLDGLGTVTPLATVTVMTRVDGQLMSIRYREGQMVQQGDLLVEIDPRPYQATLLQAQGALQRDKAVLAQAYIDLDRYQKLYARDAIPKQLLDQQVATVHQYQGIVKLDQGQVEAAQVNLVYTKITSPISGRVGLRLVDPGNIVHTTDATGMLVITQLQPITVIFTVAEDFLPDIQQQMAGGHSLEVDALDRAQQRLIAKGEVLTFSNQISTTTGTIQIKATFPNEDNALFPNQFVNARLLLATHRGATLIPAASVQRNTDGAFVYRLKPDQTVAIQAVSVGTIDGDTAEIVKGLGPGDVVAVDNFDKLQDGVRVAAKPTPTSQPTARNDG